MTRDPGLDATLASGEVPPARAVEAAEPLPEIARSTYVVRGELARGGMGKILVAEDTRLGRDVALKELLVPTAGLVERFAREVRTTARLQHPGIVAIYEAGRWPDGSPFYAMRLVKGRSLEKVVDDKPLLIDRLGLVANLVKLCEAMAYAHDRGVIHRDLKPANVLVGDYGETVVIDWGLAKDLSSDGEAIPSVAPAASSATPSAETGTMATLAGPTSASDAELAATAAPSDEALTVAGAVVGTPAYMPPEQARGDRVDKRADVYSLGALIWHVLAGRPPFAGSSADEVLEKVLKQHTAPLAEVAPEVPPELATIVERAMAPDPDARYASARELADELGRFAAGQLIASHRYTVPQLIRRWIRRHKGLFIAIQVAAIVAVAFVVVVIRGVMRDRDRARAQNLAALEEAGRAELAAHHPSRAAVYLAAAYRGGRDDDASRTMLGEAMRAVDANERSFELDGPIRELVWVGERRDKLVARTEERFWLLDPSTGSTEPLAPPQRWEPRPAVIASDGSALASSNGERVRVFDIAHRTTRVLAVDSLAAQGAIAVTANGARVAVAAGDHLVLYTGDQPTTLPVHARQVAFAADGALRVMADTTLVTLDATGQQLAEVAMPSSSMDLLACGDEAVATQAEAGDVQAELFGIYGGKVASIAGIGITGMTCRPRLLLRAKDSPILAVGSDGLVTYGLSHEHATFGDDDEWNVDDTRYDSAAAGATVIAAAVSTGELRVWDRASGIVIDRIDAHPGSVPALAFDAGDRLASGGDDGIVRVWHFAPAPAAPPEPVEHEVAARTRDGRVSALGALGDVVVTTPAGSARLSKLDELVVWIGLSSDGGLVAARARDGHIAMWNTASRAIVGEWPNAVVTVAAMASDGTLATGDREGSVRLYRASTPTPIAQLGGHSDAVRSVEWAPHPTPDGAELLTAADTSVRLWTRDGRLVRQLGNGEAILHAWWADDARLVFAETDRSFIAWDVQRGIVLATRTLGAAAAVSTGEPRPRVRADANAARGAIVTAARSARVVLPRETRDAAEVSALVERRVPWQLDDVALTPRGRQVAPRSAIVETASSKVSVYDFSDQIVSADPAEPRRELVAGTPYANAWQARRAGDARGAFVAIVAANAGAAEVIDFASAGRIPVREALAVIGATPEQRVALGRAYREAGAYDLAAEALAFAGGGADGIARELLLVELADSEGQPYEVVTHLDAALDAVGTTALAALRFDVNCGSEIAPPDPNAPATPESVRASVARQVAKLYKTFVKSRDFRYANAASRLLRITATRLHANAHKVDACVAQLESFARQSLVQGAIDKAMVRGPLAAIAPALRGCYASALDRDATLTGKVNVQFATGPAGVPEAVAAQPVPESPAMTALATCVKAEIARVVLPHANGTTRLVVHYPLVFHR